MDRFQTASGKVFGWEVVQSEVAAHEVHSLRKLPVEVCDVTRSKLDPTTETLLRKQFLPGRKHRLGEVQTYKMGIRASESQSDE
jgi:hypothetical protein